MSIPANEYRWYLSAIKIANRSENREMLRKIRDALIEEYGPTDDDVEYLLRQFRYNI